MRGEYIGSSIRSFRPTELPPHARRIPSAGVWLVLFRGTTSACAENTRHARKAVISAWNYLRMRGEYSQKWYVTFRRGRTTSACAENTSQPAAWPHPTGNYLRMRGEYGPWYFARAISWELPPHARRILYSPVNVHMDAGTTSACAENTLNAGNPNDPLRNYLRMRGEYPRRHHRGLRPNELPPHARRIR